MAREATVNYGQVAAIADSMTAAGQRPSARTIRERIGTGSMGTIHKFLTQWRGKTPSEDEQEVSALPSTISRAIADFVATEIATANEGIQEELEAAKADAESLAQDNEVLENRLEMTKNTVDDLSVKNAKLSGIIDTQNEQLASLRDMEATRNAEKIESAEMIARLTAQLEGTTRQLEAATSEQGKLRSELRNAERAVDAGQARLEAAAREIDGLNKRNEKLQAELIAAKSNTPKTATAKKSPRAVDEKRSQPTTKSRPTDPQQ